MGILWITFGNFLVFPQKTPDSCGKISLFVGKAVDNLPVNLARRANSVYNF